MSLPARPAAAGTDRAPEHYAAKVRPKMTWGGLLLLIVAGAFALRLANLGGPSLGYDEAFNLRVAGAAFDRLPGLLAASEPYPPLHFVLLHGWLALAGQTEFAARYYALIFGVLTVGLLGNLARYLFGPPAGLLTALIAAASPAFLWYAQEIKMYALLAALAALASALQVRLLWPRRDTGQALVWVAFVAVAAAALYVHYTAVLLLLFLIGAGLVAGARHGRIEVLRWLAAAAAIGVLFLPWLWFARQLLGGYESSAPAGLVWGTLRSIWAVFGVGYSDELHHQLAGDAWVAAAWLVLGAFALGGLVRHAARPEDRRRALYVAGAWLVPLMIFAILVAWRPVFAARHATVIAVGFYLVLGCGIAGWAHRPPLGRRRAALARWAVPSLALALLAAIWLPSLRDYFADPAYTRTDNRALAAYVREHAAPGDLLIYNAPFFAPVVEYYDPGPVASTGLPDPLPIDPEQTRQRLRELAPEHPRVWLALWQDYATDPEQVVERWLDRNTERVVDKKFASLRLVGYSTENQPNIGTTAARPVNARFGDTIVLSGYDVDTSTPTTLNLALDWQALAATDTPYTVFVHVLDTAGERIGQRDQQPKGGLAPTNRWQEGEVIRDRYRIELAAGSNPETILVGLYDATSGQRLPVTAGPGAGSSAVPLPFPAAAPQ